VVVVLVEPQDHVNVAATIRAMKNMGVARLRLVNPAPYDLVRIAGIAHDTDEIIAAIQHVDTLAEACADCVHVLGFTARRRAAKLNVLTPRDAANRALEAATEGDIALIFGREDKGLTNDQLDMAHVVATIPTTGHASLNLAQAVLIGLYELHLAAADVTRTMAPPRKAAPPTTAAHFELLFGDAERALEAMDFFKTRYRAHVMRGLRSLVYRAEPDTRETDLLRAMAIEVLRTIDRVARRAAGSPSQDS
jgi:TrmH family RNA methyltransferase